MKNGRRRQWGTEKSSLPQPIVHSVPSPLKIALSRVAVILTILAWFSYTVAVIIRQFIENDDASFRFTMEALAYWATVTLLSFSALMYLVARTGALQRFAHHKRSPRVHIDEFFATNEPSLTVLIPSYAEEPDVVRATMLSAMLQEYPSMRVVLLIDDPAYAEGTSQYRRLEATRQLPEEMMSYLSEPREHSERALEVYLSDPSSDLPGTAEQLTALIDEFDWAARWLEKAAEEERCQDHVDDFLVSQVLLGQAYDFHQMAVALRKAQESGEEIPPRQMASYFRRITSVFSGTATSFERKAFLSTSHEANKAMNLNSYIALMGGTYYTKEKPSGVELVAGESEDGTTITIPDSDYLLTLDADSILLREYCLRLVYYMELPTSSDVAVCQTPYSAFRGAGTRIERIAGATTDLQHLQHQGMTKYGATFWVGANAIIRKRAIEEIAELDTERGYPIKRYIQDRTVIEDTESSIDMVNKGWQLVNYPERLSYSATPPDFGSLVVQRRRWANGGLIIMTKHYTQLNERRRARMRISLTEAMLRTNYMASIAWATFGLMFLLAYPYDSRLLSPLVILTAAPYFICMASDLHYCGYKRTDIFRIYGFNLVLLPVNLAGVLTSLLQGLTGRKIPFARTPKVKNRTLTPAIYLIVPWLIVGFSIFTMQRDITNENWGNAAFAGINAALCLWAIISFIGLGNCVVDLAMSLYNFVFPEVRTSPRATRTYSEEDEHWREILRMGPAAVTIDGGHR